MAARGRTTMQAAVWLCLGARALGLSDVGADFRLVDESGSNVLADAAANVAHGFRPSARTLDLSFRAHNTTFGYRLHRQTVSPAGGEVFSYGEDGTVTRSALDEHLFFRSPDHDAVLTIVGRSFQGTVRVGSKVFDIEHEHGSPTLLVEHVTHLSGDMTGLHPNGSVAYSAPSGRRLAAQTPTKWEDCWEGIEGGSGPMKAFRIGVIVTSGVYKHYNWQSKSQAQQWVQDQITRANMAFNTQLHIHITLGSLVVQESAAGAPSWDNAGCSFTINRQLEKLADWEPVDTSVGHWHLFDNCYNWKVSNTIGLAYLAALCRPYYGKGHRNFNTGISYISEENYSPTYLTFTHELGHNFGAQHSFEEGQGKTGGIMDYGVKGMLDGLFQFNEKYRKTEICNLIKSKLDSCPAFSDFEPVCGNGVKEMGEDCECADGSTGCQGCCSCKFQLNTAGQGATAAQCSFGAIGHGGCCTPSGNYAEVGTNCSLSGWGSGWGGYCNRGQCVTENICATNSAYSGYCGLDGCKIRCINAWSGACISLSNVRKADGSSIDNLPEMTDCKDSNGLHGKCSATGTCITGVTIEGPVATLAPAEPNPYSTERNFTGCVGFADRGFLGRAEQLWHEGMTLDDCNLACLDSPKCHSFIHKQDAGFCELWSRYQLVEDMAVVPGYDTYICDLRAAGFDFLDAMMHESTIVVAPDGVPPRDRSQLFGMTRSTCYKTCATDPGCHIFEFGKTDGSCKLYTSEVSEVNFDPAAPGGENYDTYKMTCHGRGKICECDPSPTAKIRMPCQCNKVTSPYKNECDIDQYCHNGVCSDAAPEVGPSQWPPRRLVADAWCPGPTPPPTVAPTITTTFATITETSITTTTTTNKFLVHVAMALTSTGTEARVESAIVYMAAAKHQWPRVTANATAVAMGRRLLGKDRKLLEASYRWKVAYELVLDDEDTAKQHVQIAKDAETNKDATKQLIQQAFESHGLNVDTSDLEFEAPTKAEIHSSCYDTNFGRKDPFDDACEVYRRDPDLCGDWNDEDFSSDVMCCACNGGSQSWPGLGTDQATGQAPPPPPTLQEPEPGCTSSTDNGAKDETGDGCSVYEQDPLNWCGQFDDDDFDSFVMCCACRPFAPPTPAPTTPAPGGDDFSKHFGFIDGAASQRLSALAVIGAALALGP